MGKVDKRQKLKIKKSEFLSKLQDALQREHDEKQAFARAQQGPIATLSDVAATLPAVQASPFASAPVGTDDDDDDDDDLFGPSSSTPKQQPQQPPRKQAHPAAAGAVGGKRVTSRRGRHSTSIAETLQFQNILKNQAFQADPFAALQQHLGNSLAHQRQQRK